MSQPVKLSDGLGFPRTLANLRVAVRELPHVLVFDDHNLRTPFRQVALFEDGNLVSASKPIPRWLKSIT